MGENMRMLRRVVGCVSAAVVMTSVVSAVAAPASTSGPVVSIGSSGVVEGDALSRLARFTITVSPVAIADIRVRVATNNVTADSDDYQPKAVTLRIRAGRPGATFAVRVFGDNEDEVDETFAVKLSRVVGATIGRNPGIGTIYTDDIAPLAAPVITGVTARGGFGDSIRPQVFGTSLDGSSVELFVDSPCTGTPWAFTSANEFGMGIAQFDGPLTYGEHQLYARASATMLGTPFQSACSLPFAYTPEFTVSSIGTRPDSASLIVVADTSPEIFGVAPEGSTVTIFTSAGCSGLPFETDSAEAFNAGITIAVPAYTATQLSVSANLQGGLTTGCVEGPLYQEWTPITETEPNDAQATANALPAVTGYPSGVNVFIAGGGFPDQNIDTDVFRLDLPSGSSHAVHVIAGNDLSGTACLNASGFGVEVLDASFGVVGSSAASDGSCAEVTAPAVSGDHVFVRVMRNLIDAVATTGNPPYTMYATVL